MHGWKRSEQAIAQLAPIQILAGRARMKSGPYAPATCAHAIQGPTDGASAKLPALGRGREISGRCHDYRAP